MTLDILLHHFLSSFTASSFLFLFILISKLTWHWRSFCLMLSTYGLVGMVVQCVMLLMIWFPLQIMSLSLRFTLWHNIRAYTKQILSCLEVDKSSKMWNQWYFNMHAPLRNAYDVMCGLSLWDLPKPHFLFRNPWFIFFVIITYTGNQYI